MLLLTWNEISAQVVVTADFDSGSVGKISCIDSMWLYYAPTDSVGICTIQLRSRIDPKNPVRAAPTQAFFR